MPPCVRVGLHFKTLPLRRRTVDIALGALVVMDVCRNFPLASAGFGFFGLCCRGQEEKLDMTVCVRDWQVAALE